MDISNLKPKSYHQLDAIVEVLLVQKDIDSEKVLEICNNDSEKAKALIKILENLNLVKVFWIDQEPGFIKVIKKDKLSSFIESGTFTEKYLGSETISKAEEIAMDLIVKFKDGIPLSEILVRTKGDNQLTTEVGSIIQKFGFIPKESENGREPRYYPEISKVKTEELPISEDELENLFEKEKSKIFIIKNSPYKLIDRKIPPCFEIDRIAKVFAEHISSLGQNEAGQMVGVFGKWGRGKTYFVEEVCDTLGVDFEKEIGSNKFHFVRFQAWKYQDTPAIWAYLYEVLSDKYLEGNEFCKFSKRVYLNIRKEGWGILKDLILTGLFWGIISLIFYLIDGIGDGAISNFIDIVKKNLLETFLGGTFFTSIIRFYKKEGQKAQDLLKKYSKGISFSKHLGVQAEIEKELINLLTTWMKSTNEKNEEGKSKKVVKKRLLLFVDDIDRCSEDKIIELVDALRVMLEHPEIIKRVIILIAIDEEKLKFAITQKYEKLIPHDDNRNEILKRVVDEYMDKLFISGIKLQSLNSENVKQFGEKLVIEDYRVNESEKYLKYNENDATQNQTEETPNININQETTIPKIDTKEKSLDLEDDLILFIKELESLHSRLEDNKMELTPRQIRIFYYRYKMAKELVISLGKMNSDDSINIDELDKLLVAIKEKTLDRTKDYEVVPGFFNQIAEMVVGY
jgi:tRNA A37 threonylcarbamoyladenosine biosynthesis protein TsaE